jgi:hypothetical protein
MQEKPTITCLHCQAEHPQAHHERVVHNITPLFGPWAGWRMAGRELVSPDGDRVTARRLAGILWTERSRRRTLKIVPPQPSSVVLLPARESFTDIS